MADVQPCTKPINRALSASAARHSRAKPGECWSNAAQALVLVCQHDSSARYVEGWVLWKSVPVPIKHGWIETDTEIIEPTLYGPDDDDLAYFPGPRYTHAQLMAELAKNCRLPIVHRRKWGTGGQKHPEFMAAFHAALRFIGYTGKLPDGAKQ